MSVAWQFYISTVLIYLGVDVIACWGLNLQFGVAGLVNFAFIIFQAAGAYTAAVLTLGPAEPASQGGFQPYVGGAHLPFPLPILAAGLVGGLLAALVSGVTVRRLRSDYEAMVMLVVSLIATSVATNQVGLVNGPNGLALVPKPLSTLVNLSPIDYQWLFVGITAPSACACTGSCTRHERAARAHAARGPRQRAGGGGAGQERPALRMSRSSWAA